MVMFVVDITTTSETEITSAKFDGNLYLLLFILLLFLSLVTSSTVMTTMKFETSATTMSDGRGA
jgi:hypothetical protein